MPDRATAAGAYVLPLLNLIFYFLNFIPADMGKVSKENDTVLTPPGWSFLIWLLIYIWEFVFIIHQIGSRRIRNSQLIQKQISLLWISHQICTAAYLLVVTRQRVVAATAICVITLAITCAMYLLITHTFRHGLFSQYKTKDFFIIETPFAILLGWETVAAILSLNVLVVHLYRDGTLDELKGVGGQIGTALVSAGLLAGASVLYAGLPFMMNPFLHLPILWGLFGICWRWSGHRELRLKSGPVGKWATDPILRGFGYGASGLFIICLAFFATALILFVSAKLHLPGERVPAEGGDSLPPSEYEGWSSSSGQKKCRSPRTARSALSA